MENNLLGGEGNDFKREGASKMVSNKSLAIGVVIFLIGVGLGILAKNYAAEAGWTIGAEDYKEIQFKSDLDFFASEEMLDSEAVLEEIAE